MGGDVESFYPHVVAGDLETLKPCRMPRLGNESDELAG